MRQGIYSRHTINLQMLDFQMTAAHEFHEQRSEYQRKNRNNNQKE